VTAKPLTPDEERVLREDVDECTYLDGIGKSEVVSLFATLDTCRESLRRAESERDEARLKANILADGAFHDGKERSRLTDWTTELRAQVSALTAERDEALAAMASDGADAVGMNAVLRAQRDRLAAALRALPMNEFGDALREGCDANGAWDCVCEAISKHIDAALAGTPLPPDCAAGNQGETE
jgi:hypothetical protein